MRLAAILAVILVMANRSLSAAVGIGPDPDISGARDAVDRFSVDLYGRITAGNGNLVYSPLSVYSALMMTAAGARGETAKEMSAALGVENVASVPIQAANGVLLGRISKSDPDFQLHIASAIWAQEGLKCLPEFRDILENDYHAKMRGVDFHDPARASGAINDWVADQTAGKITNLFSPESIAPDTRMVLANAIYFKADWQWPFTSHLTRDGDFHVTGEAKPIATPMMRMGGVFLFSENDRLQAIELPYKGGNVAMEILLPRSNDGLASLESGLSPKFLAELENGMKREAVEVTIPKFKFSTEFGLAEKLKEMGMASAFTPGRADFSGIDGEPDLYISNVRHKAFIAVDEQGTEAAAATGIVMAPTAVLMPRMAFTADHPFLFLIRDKKSGVIFFLGRVENPKG